MCAVVRPLLLGEPFNFSGAKFSVCRAALVRKSLSFSEEGGRLFSALRLAFKRRKGKLASGFGQKD